jgi:hypothetical protein
MLQSINYSALARRLLANGYTTYALGREVGLSQPAISRLANGRTKAISADAGVALIRLAGGSVTVPPEAADTASTQEAQREAA